jgi:hypothetical protein
MELDEKTYHILVFFKHFNCSLLIMAQNYSLMLNPPRYHFLEENIFPNVLHLLSVIANKQPAERQEKEERTGHAVQNFRAFGIGDNLTK